MVKINNCCCFTLRTGTLILGYLNVIFGFLLTLICILAVAFGKDVLNSIHRVCEPEKRDETSCAEFMKSYEMIIYPGWFALIGGFLMIALSSAILGIFLIIGVYQQKEKYILINEYVWIAFTIIAVFIVICQTIYYSVGAEIGWAFSSLICGILMIALNIFFIMVIHSYRLQIREPRKQAEFIRITDTQPS